MLDDVFGELDVLVAKEGLLDRVEEGLVLAEHFHFELVLALAQDAQFHGQAGRLGHPF